MDRELAKYEGQYDCILFFGAMSAPGYHLNTKMFVFTDSCRWLSSRNKHDESCHFRSEREAQEWLKLEGDVYRSASRVFVGSQFVRGAIVDNYAIDSKRVVVSHFGAGFGFGDSYEKSFDGQTILYVGKGDFEKKGGVVLLKAFELIRRQVPEAQLHIVGQEHLPQMPGLTNHGFVGDRTTLVNLMRKAHVLTLPSLVDRFGIVLLEAMAAATPCVSSDYGAMPEIVGDAGLVAPCNDEAALATAIVTILKDADLARRMGERGRDRYLQTYHWDAVWNTVRSEIRSAMT